MLTKLRGYSHKTTIKQGKTQARRNSKDLLKNIEHLKRTTFNISDSALHLTKQCLVGSKNHDIRQNTSSGDEFQSTLQLVEIYFDTATFDNIERDEKIKTEAQLSLIGGTMGLLTGFSIISGMEIVFFLLRQKY